jgi:hypothetical protein
MLALFAQIRSTLEIILVGIIIGLSMITWIQSGKIDKLTKTNATLVSDNSTLSLVSKNCSEATTKAVEADIKKAKEVAEAQKKILGLANKQVKLAQDILSSQPKSEDLCKESYDLMEQILVGLKKESGEIK